MMILLLKGKGIFLMIKEHVDTRYLTGLKCNVLLHKILQCAIISCILEYYFQFHCCTYYILAVK